MFSLKQQRAPVGWTSAYVKPGAVYADPGVAQWLGTPADIEADFEHKVGRLISEEYVAAFERDLVLLERNLKAAIEREETSLCMPYVEMRTELFYLDVFQNARSQQVIVKKVFMRPCAERLGIFRILIFHLARYCLRGGWDLYFEHPFEDTKRIMTRAFGRFALTIDSSNYRRRKRGGDVIAESPLTRLLTQGEYMVVPNEDLVAIGHDLLLRLGLIDEVDPSRSLVLQPMAAGIGDEKKIGDYALRRPIALNRRRFPPAAVLNFGPVSSR